MMDVATHQEINSPFYTPAEAARYLRLEESTLNAMRWRKAQAQSAKPKPVEKKQAPKSVRPAAEAKTKPRKAQLRESAMKRLGQSGSVDDAAAAILALNSES